MRLYALSAFLVLTACAPEHKSPWDTDADFRRDEPKVLACIEKFRADPEGSEGRSCVQFTTQWGMQVPYIGFTLFPKYVSELDKRHPYYPQLVVASMHGEMELKLRNPGRTFADSEIAAASLGNMLKVYGVLETAHPDTRIRIMEEYARLNEEGKLLSHFDGIKVSGSLFGNDTLPSEYPAFDFGIRLSDSAGKTFGLSEWKGQGKIIAYMSAACPHCRTLARRLKSEVAPGAKAVLVFNQATTSGQARTFEDSVKTGFPRYFDSGREFARRYGGGGVPVLLLLRKDGSVLRARPGADTTMARIISEANEWASIKPASAPR